jgi:hypothetical protein
MEPSGLGLSEETVEFATGGIEGALFGFPAIVDQRTTVQDKSEIAVLDG